METQISMLLKEYGLDDNEAEIYLFLVGSKETSAYKIAKETRIHKSTCYDILERLINKGFVSRIEGKKALYSANEVSKILSSIKNKENIILSLIPELERMERKQETKIKYLDTQESQREFDLNLLNLFKNKKLTFAYVLSNGPSEFFSTNALMERIIREAKKAGVVRKFNYKGIWDEKMRENKDYMRVYSMIGESRFLNNIPTKATIVIYDERLAFLFTDSSPKVIEIKNKMVSEEMKAYFLHLWKIARR